jgi:hypothetical protein
MAEQALDAAILVVSGLLDPTAVELTEIEIAPARQGDRRQRRRLRRWAKAPEPQHGTEGVAREVQIIQLLDVDADPTGLGGTFPSRLAPRLLDATGQQHQQRRGDAPGRQLGLAQSCSDAEAHRISFGLERPLSAVMAQCGARLAIRSFAPAVRPENIAKSILLTETNTPTSRPGAKAT